MRRGARERTKRRHQGVWSAPGGKLEAMSEITAEQVAHLAALSRIALTDAELESLTGELSSIVHAVERVNEVATPAVPATSHPIPLTNAFRDDVVEPPLTQAEVLSGAPAKEQGMFRVPTILGDEQ